MWIVYAGVGVVVFIFGVFVIGMLVATVMDWDYRRRNRAWIELKRDHTKPRRPVAK